MKKGIKTVFKRVILIFIVMGGFFALSYTSKSGPEQKVKTIVIDAGHGGKDPGCHGSTSKEKDVTLAVALKLGAYIEKHLEDVKVIYTRKTDVFIGLEERALVANNAKADLFISIHCNAAANWVTYKDSKGKIRKKEVHNPEPYGSETYVMGIKNEKGKTDIAKRENAAILLEDDYKTQYEGFDPNSDEAYIIMSMFTDVYLERSLNIASKIQREYKEKANRADKGVKRASLWVLWRTSMPSILTEIGFLTNPVEEHFLGSEEGQEYVAKSIFNGLRKYKGELEGISKKYEDEFEKLTPYNPGRDSLAVKEALARADSAQAAKKTQEEVRPEEKEMIKQAQGTEPGNKEEKKNTGAGPAEEVGKIKEKENKETPPQPLKNEEQENGGKVVENVTKKIETDTIIFSVQVVSSDKKLPADSEKLKGEKVNEYSDKGVYKYAVGELNTLDKAVLLQAELRKKGFTDAFIIAFRNRTRIPVNEAVKLTKKE